VQSVFRYGLIVAIAFLIWTVLTKFGFWVLGQFWSEYQSAHSVREFSTTMLLTRLFWFFIVIFVVSIFCAVASKQRRFAWISGIVIFVFSIPDHLFPGFLWDEFPAWYHYSYLFLIIPLSSLFASLTVRN